jgi:hypothetical protein
LLSGKALRLVRGSLPENTETPKNWNAGIDQTLGH